MWRIVLSFVAGLVLLTGCGSSDPDDGVARSISTEPMASPTGEVVLTIEGEVTQPNVADRVEVDMASLEAVGTVTATVFEPFVSEEIEFTGVPLERVLQAAGIGEDVPLVFSALDGYEVPFTLGELLEDSAIIATQQNGERIAVADGGPIRVVFTRPDGPVGRNTSLWIWSLSAIEAG